MKKSVRKNTTFFLAFLFLILGFGLGRMDFYLPKIASKPTPSPFEELPTPPEGGILVIDPTKKPKVKVWYAIDGDTIRLYGGESVRYLGIDAETIYKKDGRTVNKWGAEAADVNEDWVKDKVVELEFEPQGRLRDRYGRVLAYVWLKGEMLNLKLLKMGLVHLDEQFIKKDTKYKKEFLDAEKYAKENHLGLWSETKE